MVKEIIDDIDNYIKGNHEELAFLLPKTKIERFFFGKIAQELENSKKYHVGLEINSKDIMIKPPPLKKNKRIDMIIYDSNWNPLAICEGKMYYTFNLLFQEHYPFFKTEDHDAIVDDIEWLQNCSFKQDKLFFLILGHYDTLETLDHFNYSDDHNKAIKKRYLKDTMEFRKIVSKNLDKYLENYHISSRSDRDIGIYCEIPLSIIFRVISI